MRVLIADKFDQAGIDELQAAGCEVLFEPTLDGDSLRDAIARDRPAALIVRGTRVTGPMLEASNALSIVVRAGAGVNAIDVATASRRSIRVANCPGKNAVAVAELTFALILALDRRVVECAIDLQKGLWNKKLYAKARGIKGRTLGLVGFGKIAQAVNQRARAFEMPVVAWSRSLTDERAEAAGVARCESPADVASRCDILSLHLAAAPQTRHIINRNVLEQLEPGSYVINTARAEVMDYEALAEIMKVRHLRVGLDVFPDEPASGEGAFTSPIIMWDRLSSRSDLHESSDRLESLSHSHSDVIVYGTHHIGASTDQAQAAISRETVAIVKEFLHTGHVKNCVNLCARTPAKYVIVVRHLNRPGVLAHTLHEISHAGVNVEEMENVICEGAESACAQIKLDRPLSQDVLTRIEKGNEHVFAVSHTRLPE